MASVIRGEPRKVLIGRNCGSLLLLSRPGRMLWRENWYWSVCTTVHPWRAPITVRGARPYLRPWRVGWRRSRPGCNARWRPCTFRGSEIRWPTPYPVTPYGRRSRIPILTVSFGKDAAAAKCGRTDVDISARDDGPNAWWGGTVLNPTAPLWGRSPWGALGGFPISARSNLFSID